MGGQKITRVREPVGSNGAQVGQFERRAEIFADVAARAVIRRIDPEAQATRDDGYFLRFDANSPEFGIEGQSTMLRHYQQLAVGCVEKLKSHGLAGDIQVDPAAGTCFRRTVSCDWEQALDEIGGGGGQRRRIPAQLIGRKRLRAGLIGKRVAVERLERPVRDRGSNSVEPRSAIGVPRRGERRTRELLRIQIVGAMLRRVPSKRQSAGQCFRRKFVAETRLVAEHAPPQAFGGTFRDPRRIWSRSMLTNSARKLPWPKPSSPLRSMISKKMGPIRV